MTSLGVFRVAEVDVVGGGGVRDVVDVDDVTRCKRTQLGDEGYFLQTAMSLVCMT